MSQKNTPRLITFLIVALVVFGCSLFQPKPPITDEEWITYSTELFTINLPRAYLGAEPGTANIQVLSKWMDDNGYDGQGFEAFVEANSPGLLYTAYSTKIGDNGGLTQITLAGDRKNADFRLEEYVDFYVDLMRSNQYEISSHEQKIAGDKEVDVVFYDETVGDLVFTDGAYIFETSDRFWKLEFFAPKNEFQNRLREFERIVLEFQPIDN